MENVKEFRTFVRQQILLGVLFAAALQILPVSVYIAVLNTGIFHPLLWFWTVLSTLLSIRLWLPLIPLLLPMVFIGIISLRTLAKRPNVVATRFQGIASVFSLSTAFKMLSYLLLSVLLPGIYIKLSGQSMCKPCSWSSELSCLNPTNLYIVTCGIWSGQYYFCCYQLFPKEVRFPITTQLKLSQIRFRIVPAFTYSFRRTIAPVLYFIGVFYVCSPFVTSVMSKIYNCQKDDDSFFLFLNPFVLFQAWLMSSMVYFSMWALVKCVKVYLTDVYPFQLLALVSENFFQQLHGFYSLHLLSLDRIGNASEVFCLSQPGGIPHTWNALLTESLRVIKDLQNDIEVVSGTKWQAPNPAYEQPISPSISSVHLRRLYAGTAFPAKKMTDRTVFLRERVQHLFNTLMTFAPLRYFFAPVPEEQLATILERSQHVVWAVESLSILTGRALREDRFGVVVNDIPSIVMTILNLRSILEKTKLGSPGRQQHRDRPGRMRAALLSAVNRGLCRIAVIYSDYLDNLYLPPDALRALKVYVS